MPRTKAPILTTLIQFFMTAPIAEARVALTTAATVLATREAQGLKESALPLKPARARRDRRRLATATTPATAVPSTPVTPAAPRPRRSRVRKGTAPGQPEAVTPAPVVGAQGTNPLPDQTAVDEG